MRRRIWQFLFPGFCCRFTTLSRVIEWLQYPEPCVSCQSPAAAGLGSPGDSRSHSGHVGNTRRRRLITCCRLWPSARRFWLGLHLGLHSPQKQSQFYKLCNKTTIPLASDISQATNTHIPQYSNPYFTINYCKTPAFGAVTAFTLGMRGTW